MKRFRLAVLLGVSLALFAPATSLAVQSGGTAAAQPAAAEEDPDARWRRLQAEVAARAEAERAARQRYEDGLREAAEARARYEESQRAHQAEVARLEADRVAYERRRAEYEREVAGREGGSRRERRREASSSTGGSSASAGTSSASTNRCEARNARNRRRGRGIGAIVGAGAGLLGRRAGAGAGLLAAALPVGAVLGEVMVRLLDSCEQEQAAAATEEAVRGGVGTTATWTSETRPGVTGASVVTAAETGSDGECLTVTDIVIVDGEETRAPKRMCRRPPSNRYMRV